MQYSLKARITNFGEEGGHAVMQEFNALYMIDTRIPETKENLSKEQRKEALQTIMFLKENCGGTLKGQMCANSSTQRGKYEMEDSVSPNRVPGVSHTDCCGGSI